MISLLVLFLTLLLVRVATFVTFLPIFGGQTVPRLVKVGLTLTLTIMWSMDVFANPNLPEWATQQSQVSWFGFGLLMAREALFGAVLGFAFGLFLVPARVAGEFLTQEMGLSFGNLVDPSSGMAASPLTVFFDLLGTMVFFVLDIHHVVLTVFHATFASFPMGGTSLPAPLQHAVVGAELTQGWGLLVIAPAALCLFLTTVALALTARAVPQMNMYAIGFPLRLIVGLIALLVLLPGIIAALISVFGRSAELIGGMV